MDGSTIFYIIAVIVYFIYSSFTKKKEEEARGEMEESENMPKQGPSFEELLREIRKDQNPDIVEEVEEEWVEETRHRKYKKKDLLKKNLKALIVMFDNPLLN